MNIPPVDQRRAAVAEAAAEWLQLLESEQASVEQRGQFVDWLRESPLHVAEMLRIGGVHAALSGFKDWQEFAPAAQAATARQAASAQVVPLSRAAPEFVLAPSPATATKYAATARRRVGPRQRVLASLVATLAILGLGAVWLMDYQQSHIRTQRSEHREIRLSDGSLVEMAAASELQLQLGPKERRVALTSGEVLFRVAHESDRPFVVAAGKTRIKATGTAFSVARSDATVVVTVAEGTVRVWSVVSPERALSLSAGQQLQIDPNGLPRPVRAVDSRAELAWTSGLLILDDEPVAEVARRFNARNRVQVQILDPALAARRVSGVFEAADPQSFVAFLESAAGASVVRDAAAGTLVVRSEDVNPGESTTRIAVPRH
jgi:transmembrane sensor